MPAKDASMIARRLPSSAIRTIAVLTVLGGTLAGCAKDGEIVVDQGVGITAVRSRCPAVGIPDYTGDVTLFRTAGDKSATNLDVVASMTNVRSQCNEAAGDRVFANVTFDVRARRTDTSAARQVTVPYFVTVLQGGANVVSKRVGSVTLNFAAGQDRAQAQATGSAYIDRAAATLPDEIRRRITRERKAGDEDAAVDPLADPEVRTAVARATFEVLVGFQLTNEQLTYNATR
jgi:hypothetical protein